MADLADWRVIFATAGTPPRTIRSARPDDDRELTDWLVFVDGQDREVMRLNRDVVLFIDRIDRGGDDGGGIREILEGGGFADSDPAPTRPDGLARVAAAVRRARGGDPPAQIRGFALCDSRNAIPITPRPGRVD